MVTLRCDGCSGEQSSTTCYYVVSSEVFTSDNFMDMVCPITGFPTTWVDVDNEEDEE